MRTLKRLLTFTKPLTDDYLFHDIRTRIESYDARVTNATYFLVTLGAAVAVIGSDSFARTVECVWDRLIPCLYADAIAAAVLLGYALADYKHRSRMLLHLRPHEFNPGEWPRAPEVLFNCGYLLVRILALAMLTTLIWAAVIGPS